MIAANSVCGMSSFRIAASGAAAHGARLPGATAAGFPLPATTAEGTAGSVTPRRAVTMDGEGIAIASNDPSLTVYGFDPDHAGSQAITLVYAGHAVDVVLKVA